MNNILGSPKPPELDLSRGADHLNVYKVDDSLQAVCMVRDGRPVANISWYLGKFYEWISKTI